MNEVKNPKKPLMYYYGIALVVMLLFNLLFLPMINQAQIKEVDYGTFMDMTDAGTIGEVQVKDNLILFTERGEKQVYKTGRMDDPELVSRLRSSGASFSGEIVE